MKGFDKNKLKKQIVSGGIYIALAAAVVTVTLNGVNNIIGSSEDYEIPEVNLELPEVNIIDKIDNLPELNTNLGIADNESESFNKKEQTKQELDAYEKQEEIKGTNDSTGTPQNEEKAHSSGSSASGITSDVVPYNTNEISVTDNDNVSVSGEPDDIEYPTEPEPISYENYAKPAEGYIDKEYSDNDLIYSVTMGDYRTHNGIDITGDPGSAVRAINAGVIQDIYFDDFYGYTVKIDHGENIVAYYMNLSEALPAGIAVGSKVKHGQTIGGIGKTATIESAEVSHLHLSITVNGKYVDPREILRGNY